jgi:hypothetical protein
MRYQGCLEFQILTNPEDKERNRKLRNDFEQFKYLLQVKLPKLTQKTLFNQFKVTGSNINGTLGIGSEEDSS